MRLFYVFMGLLCLVASAFAFTQEFTGHLILAFICIGGCLVGIIKGFIIDADF